MSILLEALRKSEKSQKPAEAPDIHVEQHSGVDFQPLRKGPVALLLLLALLLITWLVWRQYQLPDVGYRPPVTLPANRGGAIDTPVSTLPAGESGAGPGKVVKRAAKEQRTPVENYQPGGKEAKQPGATKFSTGRPRPRAADKSVAKAVVATKKPAVETRVANKGLAPISYWELPDAIRADVEEIHFSVLVYANRPADRFVLVNGQRLQEGDSYQPGLIVEEIRRDGVVFSFRLYRFLVER